MENDSILISIVIPVYNEQYRIRSFLASVTEFLQKKDFSYEIVIVDDGSTDETVTTIKQILDEKLPGTYKVVQLPANAGKGAAIRKGCWKQMGSISFSWMPMVLQQ